MSKEIEIGEFVTIVGGEHDGRSGILDNVWVKDGQVMYTVISECDSEEFWYASTIKKFR